MPSTDGSLKNASSTEGWLTVSEKVALIFVATQTFVASLGGDTAAKLCDEWFLSTGK